MSKPTATTSTPRVPLTKERVLRAATGLVDQSGINGLSMRKLAHKLGVEAMSLYNHVANKDEILDGIVELVASEIDLDLNGADWKTSMRRRVLSAHEVLSRHPWACSLWMSTKNFGPARIGYADAVLRGLRGAGFSDDLTYHAFHVLQSHVMGYTLQESNFEFEPEELKALAADFLRGLPIDEYPDFSEHIRQHLDPSRSQQDTFEFGLDLILDSLERLRDEG